MRSTGWRTIRNPGRLKALPPESPPDSRRAKRKPPSPGRTPTFPSGPAGLLRCRPGRRSRPYRRRASPRRHRPGADHRRRRRPAHPPRRTRSERRHRRPRGYDRPPIRPSRSPRPRRRSARSYRPHRPSPEFGRPPEARPRRRCRSRPSFPAGSAERYRPISRPSVHRSRFRSGRRRPCRERPGHCRPRPRTEPSR